MSETPETPPEIEALRYGVEFIRNDVAYKSTVEAINSVEVKYREFIAAAKAALLVLYQTNNPDDLINETIADLESAITKAAARDGSEGAVRKLDESVSGFKQRVVEAVRAFPAEANRAWIIRAIESLPVGKEADTDEK